MLPSSSSDKGPDNIPKYLLEALLNLMVSEVILQKNYLKLVIDSDHDLVRLSL